MRSTVEGFTGHYSTVEVVSIDEVREVLGGGADRLNWLFLSTSGVHGSYGTLDEVFFEPWQDDPMEYDPGSVNDEITVLVVQPRMVRCYYGHVRVTAEDVPWLREQVTATLRHAADSQRGNTVAP